MSEIGSLNRDGPSACLDLLEVTWFFALLACASPGFFMLGIAKFLATDGVATLGSSCKRPREQIPNIVLGYRWSTWPRERTAI
ncbi:hypothetical protein TorRG33x02_349180 [Trema orientale]|uniref:Uncharacterized protein n=1 Tax=Trema orientale TaxID=63057 RepID=A0A2P5AIY1_TREOI|nr:hypothetical protein TorRG33x02_349180 [Trema orientale]